MWWYITLMSRSTKRVNRERRKFSWKLLMKIICEFNCGSFFLSSSFFKHEKRKFMSWECWDDERRQKMNFKRQRKSFSTSREWRENLESLIKISSSILIKIFIILHFLFLSKDFQHSRCFGYIARDFINYFQHNNHSNSLSSLA